ncbi:hypothetical protein BD289DRAFT_352828, partial [Coniella lustricola]
MFSELNEAISDAVSPWLIPPPRFPEGDKTSLQYECTTFVPDIFICNNYGDIEPRIWGSGKVTIHIRGYGNNVHNAVVYNKSCKECGKLGQMDLDQLSYIERVTYRLEKWWGMPVERVNYEQKSSPSHLGYSYEGCKAGRC